MKFFLDKKLVANGKSWLAIHGAVALFIMVIVVPQASAQDAKVQSLELVSASAMGDKLPPKERHDWTGFYVGGFVGGGTPHKKVGLGPDEDLLVRINPSVMGGGTVGYNWQLGRSPYLIGLEGEYGYLGMNGSTTLTGQEGGVSVSLVESAKVGSSYGYGLLGGRIGYLHNRTLFYAKGGAVFTSTKNNLDLAINLAPDTLTFNGASKSNDVGYAVGGGIEQALPPEWFNLAKNISVKVEYLYLGTGRSQDVTHATVCINGACGTSDGTSIMTSHFSGIHTAKLGINYRFRGF